LWKHLLIRECFPQRIFAMVSTISKLRGYSTAPSNSWTCQVLDLWTGGMFRSFLSPPQHLPSMWAKSPMSSATLHQRSHTSSKSISVTNSHAAARTQPRRGSNVHELNAWLWQFGRGKHRVGRLSVSDTEDRRIAVL
jgi:hypothetical protein